MRDRVYDYVQGKRLTRMDVTSAYYVIERASSSATVHDS